MGSFSGGGVGIGRVRVYEDVQVTVLFAHRRVIPRAVIFDRRLVRLVALIKVWDGTHRGERLRYFLTEDEAHQQFKLCFLPQNLTWFVEEVMR